MASSPLYVRLRMLVRDAPAADFQFDEITLKNAIVLALRSMYGRVGAAAHASTCSRSRRTRGSPSS